MDTKSRYEVISDLEKEKRNLIVSRESLQDSLRQMERTLKEHERDVEDQKEEIKNFKANMEDQRKTYDALIESIDKSLDKFGQSQKS